MTATTTQTVGAGRDDPGSPGQRDLIEAATRDIALLSPGVIAFGLMLGVTVVGMHESRATAVLGAALVFGGSAQLTTATFMHLGCGLVAAVLSGAVVNA